MFARTRQGAYQKDSSSGEGRRGLGRHRNIPDSKEWKEVVPSLCTTKTIEVTAVPKEEKLCRNCSLIHLLANLCQAHSSMDPRWEFADGGAVSGVTF